jgi:pyridoxamine 5'-phosphate oxidase
MSTVTETLENLRQSYQLAELDLKDCDVDPMIQFKKWFDEALSSKVDEPNAFTLSTVDGDQPRARVVLLKGMDDGGFLFYTNYDSAKGKELAHNQKASLTFLWLPLQRQVRIEGVIEKAPAQKSDDYFHKRPRGSQLGAMASPQSQKLKSRAELEELFKKIEGRYADEQVLPRPANWGGYILKPQYLEFWQGRRNRMHDRVSYTKNSSGWERARLAP